MTSDRELRARDLAAANAPICWADMSPTERDKYRAQAEREGYSRMVNDGSSDQTNPAAYVGTAMRGRLDDLATLIAFANDEDETREYDVGELDGLGVDEELPIEEAREAAQERLYGYPLCVETTTVFEIVLGTGGPDDRLIVELDSEGNVGTITYRYSWSGSAERVLSGEDYDVAERFARSVVPELTE